MQGPKLRRRAAVDLKVQLVAQTIFGVLRTDPEFDVVATENAQHCAWQSIPGFDLVLSDINHAGRDGRSGNSRRTKSGTLRFRPQNVPIICAPMKRCSLTQEPRGCPYPAYGGG